MSLVDVDSWVTEHDSCERLNHAILAQLFERQRHKPLSNEYSKASANIQLRLRQFELELDQLKLKLSTATQKRSITVEEFERRQGQIETLQLAFNQLQNKFLNSENFKITQSTSERNELLGVKNSLWKYDDDDDDDDDDEPIMNAHLPNSKIQDMRRQQIDIMENQNKGLEALSATITRQKHLSTRMGQEIGVQNEIIDNIAENLDNVDYRLNRETRNVGAINQTDNTCGYWIVILILFIAICILALV